jgi:hypothetical protein
MAVSGVLIAVSTFMTKLRVRSLLTCTTLLFLTPGRIHCPTRMTLRVSRSSVRKSVLQSIEGHWAKMKKISVLRPQERYLN